MRILILTLAIIGFGTAFEVGMSRRSAIVEGGGVLAGIVIGSPQISNAFSQQLEDHEYPEASQQATGGKIDLNNAYIVRIACLMR